MDIIDQRKTKMIHSPSEESFRTIIETIDDIVVVGTSEGQILYSNPATSAKLGYGAEELRTMKILDLHPEYLRKEASTILADMFSGKREACPLPLIRKDGSILPVETRAWFGKWNGARCIFGLSKDISKEQEALQKFDRFFRMNSAPMAVSKMPERLFVDLNEAFLRALGYAADEVIGKSSAELGLFVDKEEQSRVAGLAAEYGNFKEIELKVKTKNGNILDGLFSGDIIEIQGIKYLLTVMADITERNRAEAERRKTIEELSKALSEIRTLRGILPICANCKKIRDDKGYWERVESYISRHTEAQFTHGICPECAKTFYSEMSGG
jgi:PAS domain S-box-containing protein